MATAADAEWSRRVRSSLTLDLGSRVSDPVSSVVLSSPDVRLLKLATPELERLVLQQYSQHHHEDDSSTEHHQITLDVAPTDDYARGFVDALLELHAQRGEDGEGRAATRTTAAADLRHPASTGSVVVSGSTSPDRVRRFDGGCGTVTGQLADKPTRGQSSRGLVNSRTSQLGEMFD